MVHSEIPVRESVLFRMGVFVLFVKFIIPKIGRSINYTKVLDRI